MCFRHVIIGWKVFKVTVSSSLYYFRMSSKIILTSEPGSAKFSDRVLILGQGEVRVARSSTEDKPDTYNAVFDCRVGDYSQSTEYLATLQFYCPGFVKIPGSIQFD